MEISLHLSPDTVTENRGFLLDLGLSQEWIDTLQLPTVSTTINYRLCWPGDLLQIAKRATALRILAEQGTLKGISPEETQKALYYIDCIKEEFEEIQSLNK